MLLPELLFLICAAATATTLVRIAALAIRGKGARALALTRRLGIAVAVYMAVVLVVALAVPRRIYRIGDTQCFDDWCIAVTSATLVSPAQAEVGLRLSTRAKRVPQREKGTVVYLIDAAGRRFDPVADPSNVPLDTLLGPGEAVTAMRRFDVAGHSGSLQLVYTHEGGFPIGFFIIGENDWFHGPPAVRLDL